MDMWCKIKFQLKPNLEPNWIWTFPFLYLIIHLVQKLKIRWDMWHKIENPIYIYIYKLDCNPYLCTETFKQW